MFLSSDLDSPWKTGPDTSQTIPFGGGHPNPHFSHHHWSSHIGSYIENFMFLCSDMDSPWKTGLDTSQTIPFGGGHPTLVSATIIDLAILRAAVRISCFSIQIWILLEKWVQIQVKPSKTEVKPPGFHQYFVFSSPIRKGTNLRPSDLESPQESAPGDTHIIYKIT
jgi:hypothetical protein